MGLVRQFPPSPAASSQPTENLSSLLFSILIWTCFIVGGRVRFRAHLFLLCYVIQDQNSRTVAGARYEVLLGELQ